MSTSLILLPDAFLLLATIVAWINDMVWSEKSERGRSITYSIIVWAALIAALGYTGLLVGGVGTQYVFDHMVRLDPFAFAVKACLCAGFAFSLIYAKNYLQAFGLFRGSFFLLAIFSLIGQLVMVCGNHFLILYLGLELMSLALYAMVALRSEYSESKTQNPWLSSMMMQSTEAALKYYVLGALASGFLLFGLSMVYGATGSLDLVDVATHIKTQLPSLIAASGNVDIAAFREMPTLSVLLCGLIFIVVGVAFKLGIAPFHMWVPDVYQGAPTPITLLIAGIPKLAALAWGMRFLVIGLFPLASEWSWMLSILIVLSVLIGNVAGIVQTHIKRLFAYSAIAHAGFIALGLLAGGWQHAEGSGSPDAGENVVSGLYPLAGSVYDAYGATFFYGVIYLITTLGVFGVLLALVQRTDSSSEEGAQSKTPVYQAVEDLEGLKGLSQRNPLLAAVMLVLMFSLAGIPPTAGFYAKLSVLTQAVYAGWVGLVWLCVMASLWGAFYYLRIVKLMYFDAPTDKTPFVIPRSTYALLALNGAVVFFLGIMPGPLLNGCARVMQHMVGI